ncbi:hypothetical protein LIA77_06723 [Sarocladium implicatum]|nr:hypothetical protein LIA77_06723 [Sarocladium implicatum]
MEPILEPCHERKSDAVTVDNVHMVKQMMYDLFLLYPILCSIFSLHYSYKVHISKSRRVGVVWTTSPTYGVSQYQSCRTPSAQYRSLRIEIESSPTLYLAISLLSTWSHCRERTAVGHGFA